MKKKGMIPIHGAKSNALKWLKGRGAAGIEPETCFVFSEASFEPGLEELEEYVQSGMYISWLGGPGIDGAPWPTNANGTALAHVASFCLNEAQLHPEMVASWGLGLSLPDGYLEIYHDIETYGDSPEDRESQGRLVRYVEPRDGYGLVPPPGHSPDPVAGTECQLGLMMPGFTIPAYPNLEASGSVSFGNWEECLLELADVWHLQRFGKKAGYQILYTHLGGHS